MQLENKRSLQRQPTGQAGGAAGGHLLGVGQGVGTPVVGDGDVTLFNVDVGGACRGRGKRGARFTAATCSGRPPKACSQRPRQAAPQRHAQKHSGSRHWAARHARLAVGRDCRAAARRLWGPGRRGLLTVLAHGAQLHQVAVGVQLLQGTGASQPQLSGGAAGRGDRLGGQSSQASRAHALSASTHTSSRRTTTRTACGARARAAACFHTHTRPAPTPTPPTPTHQHQHHMPTHPP